MPSPLYLVGTVHNDLKGPQRMLSILYHFMPDVVSVENTHEGVKDFCAAMDVLVSEKGLEALAEVTMHMVYGNYHERLSWPIKAIARYSFETPCAYAWALLNNRAFHYAEKPRSQALNAAIAEHNRRICASIINDYAGVEEPGRAFKASTDEYYGQAKHHGVLPTQEDAEVIADRDQGMAESLRTLEGRVVHFSGLMHVFGYYRNLTKTVADLKPIPLTLLDGENLLSQESIQCLRALRIPIPPSPLPAAASAVSACAPLH
jgi:hypothetical protein